MFQAIRDCFFDLYDEPILERLMQSLTTRYPDVTFPPVPKRGTLDLKQVKESPYFFH
jgi:DNA-directed RNA polymerase, mitochondrial